MIRPSAHILPDAAAAPSEAAPGFALTRSWLDAQCPPMNAQGKVARIQSTIRNPLADSGLRGGEQLFRILEK